MPARHLQGLPALKRAQELAHERRLARVRVEAADGDDGGPHAREYNPSKNRPEKVP